MERKWNMRKKEEKEKVEVIKKDNKKQSADVPYEESKPQKAYFFQRFAAYIVDILIVSLVFRLITLPIPESKNLSKIEDEMITLNEKYLNEEIDTDQYVNQSISISHDAAYESFIYTIIQIALIILYFVVFQFYNKGQTLGKKIFRIRVVKSDGQELSMNDMIFRSFIINSILVNMIILAFTLLASDTIYFYTSNILQFVQGLLLIITVIMVMYRQDGKGLHDMIAKTEVVVEK